MIANRKGWQERVNTVEAGNFHDFLAPAKRLRSWPTEFRGAGRRGFQPPGYVAFLEGALIDLGLADAFDCLKNVAFGRSLLIIFIHMSKGHFTGWIHNIYSRNGNDMVLLSRGSF